MSDIQIVDQGLDKTIKNDKNKAVVDNINNKSIQELKDLLQENLELTKEVRAMVDHINRYVAWQRIFGILKVLIILVPIILGIIYLPPLFKDLYKQVFSIYNPM